VLSQVLLGLFGEVFSELGNALANRFLNLDGALGHNFDKFIESNNQFFLCHIAQVVSQMTQKNDSLVLGSVISSNTGRSVQENIKNLQQLG